jgi:cytochrome c oxidase cbb3-type subunit IV
MSLTHDFLVGFSKSFGLFYLLALSAAVLIYTYWPSNKQRFDYAAQSILAEEDKPYVGKPYGDQPHGDQSWR